MSLLRRGELHDALAPIFAARWRGRPVPDPLAEAIIALIRRKGPHSASALARELHPEASQGPLPPPAPV